MRQRDARRRFIIRAVILVAVALALLALFTPELWAQSGGGGGGGWSDPPNCGAGSSPDRPCVTNDDWSSGNTWISAAWAIAVVGIFIACVTETWACVGWIVW
jgi:hypothetical protein